MPISITTRLLFALPLAASAGAWGAAPSAYTAPPFTGSIVDAQSGQPVAGAVVSASWVLRPEKTDAKVRTQPKRLLVKQVRGDPSGQFVVPPWRQDRPSGWTLAPGRDPVVRIYAKGYQRLVIQNRIKTKSGFGPFNAIDATERKWAGENAVQALKPLAKTRQAVVKELAQWKKDLETEIKATDRGNRRRAIEGQEKLLVLFSETCQGLREELRRGLCYGSESELGAYYAQYLAERSKFLVIEHPDGDKERIPLKVNAPPAAMSATPSDSASQGYAGIPRPGRDAK